VTIAGSISQRVIRSRSQRVALNRAANELRQTIDCAVKSEIFEAVATFTGVNIFNFVSTRESALTPARNIRVVWALLRRCCRRRE
jgi:hypothetical protein